MFSVAGHEKRRAGSLATLIFPDVNGKVETVTYRNSSTESRVHPVEHLAVGSLP